MKCNTNKCKLSNKATHSKNYINCVVSFDKTQESELSNPSSMPTFSYIECQKKKREE